ncbi:hydrogen peroxide-inducible genes activator [Plebeiibacterium marinum]|uniref:LysR substrate-binding domain-containing protein n=1 Tax=Plebeiibacterium marinum TaxID=2992111 RepID=A0AAE3MDF0_9BACT|nr:hydrogen peroxide-inducible genes activator [Plebeiobacterium marinum]MCW3805560.1 LysR substrate-binding domain-containing protein [Plebeiobacterium marinum]
MITITQLEYVVAVDTYRHFVTASEKCFVSQPTLSMQIKKLEEELDIVIFDRTKQPIIPTQIGQKVIEQARRVLAENNRIYSLIKEHKQDLSGELNMGIIPSLAPYLLPLFLGAFTKRYPEVKLNISELLSEDIIRMLQKDQLDIGILVTPIKEAGIFEKQLFYERMFLYVNNSHLLAQKARVEPEEIAGEGLWLLSHGHCFRSQVVNLCSYHDQLKERVSVNYESGSLETIKRLVEDEGGYTLLPELALTDQVLNNKKAQVKNIGASDPLREVSMVYSRNFVKNQLMEVLFNTIKEVIPSQLSLQTEGHIVEWRN